MGGIVAAMSAAPKPETNARAGVLLPLPPEGAHDCRMAAALPRGSLVIAPLGNRESLGVVWGEAEGTIADEKLKEVEPLEGAPCLPEKLCDFIDWVARYTLRPPGMALA